MSDLLKAWPVAHMFVRAILALCLLPTIANAREDSEALVALRSCAAAPVPADRLACFDRVAARLLTKSPDATSAAHDPATSDQAPESSFGLSPERIRRAAATQSAPAPRLAKLRARVLQAQRQGNGGWRFTLNNGQIWYQISPSEYLDLRAGSEVVITPGWLGSFLLVDSRGHSARVHRAQ